MSVQFGNVYGPQYTPNTGGPAPMGAPTGAPNPFAPDGFASQYMAATGIEIKLPIESIVDDAGAAGRFKAFFMKTSEGLLTVGGNSFGRAFLNLLAGAVPIFTPASKRTEIAANVMSWVGRADLVRSGCSALDARLLQSCGVFTITDLAHMSSPMDQATLVGRLAMAAYQFGFPVPSPEMVSSWVSAAMTLPVRVK
jgi:hypothetical protein